MISRGRGTQKPNISGTKGTPRMAISSYKQSDTPGTKVEDKAPRIRQLAWSSSNYGYRTFGLVHPYNARSHITEWGWKDEWWTARRELRLTVRAECHYRSVSGSTLYLLLSCGVTIHAHQYLRQKSVCGNDIITKKQ
ncbi:unnamed protein product [Oncorhynchus mykiss]|uniref:Uncharacterized protein n=1 Tax=Oncorhynchus mykiss TaxID=8022 RepID=A0A060W999_ONCMY|nr:unnamed protein product [Oncorhynchus mykiss]